MRAGAASKAALALVVAVLGACAPLLPPLPRPAPAPAPVPAPRPQPLPPTPSRPAPIPERPIDVDGRCVQTEEDGFHEDARLLVRDGQVQALSWQIRVGKRGSCSFDLGSFRQTKSRPHVELVERNGSGCKLMVWQEPRRITMGHAGCERRCTPGVYDSAWPVMFDPATGGCARP